MLTTVQWMAASDGSREHTQGKEKKSVSLMPNSKYGWETKQLRGTFEKVIYVQESMDVAQG